MQAEIESSILATRSNISKCKMNITLKASDYLYLVPAAVDLIRVGNPDTDGGYVVPADLVSSVDGVLSLGIGDDWSFDQHFQQLNPRCDLHAYDGTLQLEQFDNSMLASYRQTFQGPAVHFAESVGKQFIRPEFTEFDTVIERLNKSNIFVKMDIEGGEYTLTRDIVDHRNIIAGLVIEYHGAASTSKHCFLEELPQLTHHYQVVHVHANNSGPVIEGFPDYLEITFLRRDLCESSQLRFETYIDHLDRPCSVFCDDYRMFFTAK